MTGMQAEVAPRAYDDDALAVLRHAVVRCQQHLTFHVVAAIFASMSELVEDSFNDFAVLHRKQPFHILHHKGARRIPVDKLHESVEQLVARVVGYPASALVGQAESLAGWSAHDDVGALAVQHGIHLAFLDVRDAFAEEGGVGKIQLEGFGCNFIDVGGEDRTNARHR